MVKHTKYLIIGNSAAGIGGVEGIRSVDSLGQILLISNEPYHTYSRPLISYLVENKVDNDHINYRNKNFYNEYGVRTMLGTNVESIDPNEKKVVLDNNDEISFDKLLIATGSNPFIPPIKGKEEAKNAFTFTKLDDAYEILSLLDDMDGKKPKVVILGAGLIGLKAAEALYNKSESITVLDLANRVMPSVFNKNASEVMKKHLEEKGIDLKLETSIDEIGDYKVTLSNGETLDYDILILAVGTRPAIDLVSGTDIDIDRGILTNNNQETSVKDIFSAGDCTESYDISSDQRKNIAILPNAFMQGEKAGKIMAGSNDEDLQLFPLNSMGLLGLYMLTAGAYDGESIIVESPESFKEFFIKDNKLKGYIIIGTCQRGGIYTDLIRNQTDLSGIDKDGLFEEPGLCFFDKEKRLDSLSRAH